jgi:hypothetical protein
MTESLPAQASEAARAAFVTAYGALLNGLSADEDAYYDLAFSDNPNII